MDNATHFLFGVMQSQKPIASKTGLLPIFIAIALALAIFTWYEVVYADGVGGTFKKYYGNNFSFADSTTYIAGNNTWNTVSATTTRYYEPVNADCTISRVVVGINNIQTGVTNGSSEKVIVNIRHIVGAVTPGISQHDDYISSVSFNTAGNYVLRGSVDIAEGDAYAVSIVTPVWVTNPVTAVGVDAPCEVIASGSEQVDFTDVVTRVGELNLAILILGSVFIFGLALSTWRR